MTDPQGAPPAGPPDDTLWPYIGVGCLTLVVGLFGGGMIAMLIGKIVDGVSGCKPADGTPVCDWWKYFYTGALVGAVLLPSVAVYRMRRGRKNDSNTNG
jgi:hypothetical protein